MEIATNNSHQVMEAVESLRDEIARLKERITAIEERVFREDSKIANAPAKDHFSEELLLVISAAIAAYLGVKPHIRQIRLLSSHPWSQQGRVTIQAAHDLAVHHS